MSTNNNNEHSSLEQEFAKETSFLRFMEEDIIPPEGWEPDPELLALLEEYLNAPLTEEERLYHFHHFSKELQELRNSGANNPIYERALEICVEQYSQPIE